MGCILGKLNKNHYKEQRGPQIGDNYNQATLLQLKQKNKRPQIRGERVYLKKDELKYEQLMILLASSAKKQTLKKHYEQRFQPLEGVNYDIDNFVEKFKGYRYHCIQSSQDEGIVLTKQYILKAFQKYFSKPALYFFFFYSGHGDQDLRFKGDIILQSIHGKQERKKEPWKYSISIQQLIEVWNKNKLCLQSHLFIFMDSCYSGDWCQRLSRMQETTVSIMSSCSPHQISYGFKGGFFFTTILKGEADFNNNQELLRSSQEPMFIRRSKRCTKLSKDHLKLLQEDIKNVINFNSETDNLNLRDFNRKDEMANIQKKKILQYEEKISNLQNQVGKINQVEKQNKQLKQKLTQQRNDNALKINKLQQQIKQYADTTKKLTLGIQSKKKPLTAAQFIDTECHDIKQIKINQNTFTNSINTFCNIVGKVRLVGQCSYTFTFTKIGGYNVSVGVIDSKYKNLSQYQEKHVNCIRYVNNGNCFIGLSNKHNPSGKAFRIGQPIKMTVNIDEGSIQFKIGSQSTPKALKLDALKDKNVLWVPWIRLQMEGDSINISQ